MSSGGKWGRTALLAIGLAAVHFVIIMFSFVATLWGAFAGLKWWAQGLPYLFMVVGFPVSFMIGSWIPSDPTPEALASFVGTSLLWGTGLALLWRWWRLRVAERRRARGL